MLIDTLRLPLTSGWQPPLIMMPVLIDTLRPPLTSVWQPPLIMTPVLLLYLPPPSPASVLPSTSNEWSPNTSEHRANASLRTSKTNHLIHKQLLVPEKIKNKSFNPHTITGPCVY